MYVLGMYAHLHVHVIHMYYAYVYLHMLACVREHTYVCMGRVEVSVKCFLLTFYLLRQFLAELTAHRFLLV